MTTHQLLDPTRLWLLIKRDVVLNNRSLLIGSGIVIGLLVIIPLASTLYNQFYLFKIFYQLATILFFGFGLVVSCQGFQELRKSETGLFYLTTPASQLEKVLAVWLLRAPVYAIVAFSVFYLLSIVVWFGAHQITGAEWQVFDPLDTENLKLVAHYGMWQSIFFFGGLYFQQKPLLKTTLSLIALVIGFSLWTGFAGYGIAKLVYDIGSTNTLVATGDASVDTSAIHPFLQGIEEAGKWLYWLMLPFFLVLSYIRLKEVEV